MSESNNPNRGELRHADEVAAIAKLADLARQQLPGDGETAARDAYARFRQRTQGASGRVGQGDGRGHGRRWIWPAAAGTTVAVAAAIVLVTTRTTPDPVPEVPLNVTIEGGVADQSGYIRAAGDAEPRLLFSDGTRISVGRTSRVRVTTTSPHGARVLLDEGRAAVEVVPRKNASWIFDAGPCRVHVTGTHFDVRWSSAEQVLELTLFTGSVVVHGPPASAGLTMRAGQRLTMDVGRGSVHVDDDAGPSSRSSNGVVGRPREITGSGESDAVGGGVGGLAAPPTGAATPELSPRGNARTTTKAGRGAAGSWQARVLAGEFLGVIDEARHRGLDEVLRTVSAPDAMALADAARYAGTPTLARRALLSVRARFPDSPPSWKAAFLLGRMAEDHDGDVATALEWYRSYLADTADNAYRAEALGRQMTATLRLYGTDRARPMARDYLRRYPGGAYGKAARAILEP